MTGQAAGAPAKRHPTAGKASAKPLRAAPVYTLAATVAGQPQLSTRTIVRVFFTLVALGVLLYTLYLVRSVVGLLLIAVFLAVALGPAVDRASRMKLPRGVAILAVFLCLFLAIFLIGLVVVPPIVDEVQAFAEDVPSYIDDIRENDTLREYDDKYDITAKLEDQASSLPSRLGDAAGALQAVTVGVFSTVIQLVTVLTIAFFLLLDGGRIVNFLLAQVRREHQQRVRAVAGDIYNATGGYVAGALTLATAAGISTYILLSVLGVPFAVPLAVLMAFFDLIPLVGSTIGGVLVAAGDAVRRLPPGHADLGGVRRRLPADREQRAAAARLPPRGQPAPAGGDHRHPDRVEPARGARRARRDPDRRGDPDHAQGPLGQPPLSRPRRERHAARDRGRRAAAARGRAAASDRRADEDVAPSGRRFMTCRAAAGAAARPPARPRAPATAL